MIQTDRDSQNLGMGDDPMEDVRRFVEQIVHTYGTRDPFQLSRQLNLHLIPTRTPSGLWGVLLYHAQQGFFSYDNAVSATHQSLYIAHALAHHVLHREHSRLFVELDDPGPSPWEAEAREFADQLLFKVDFTSCLQNSNVSCDRFSPQ